MFSPRTSRHPRPGSRRAPLAVCLWLCLGSALAAQEAPKTAAASLPSPSSSSTSQAPDGAAASIPKPGETTPSDPPASDKIQFALPMPAERGGGVVTGSSGTFDSVENRYAVLGGGVEFTYQETTFRADQVKLDQQTGVVEAEGHVEIERGPERLKAATATYDLNARTGSFTQAEVRANPGYFFTGAQVAKVDEDVYTVEEGTFTSCDQETPQWSFHVKRARVRLDGYAKAKNVSFRIKKAPVLFTPYILWPVRDERTSGLLLPQPGYSSRRGASLSLAYYQVLGRSYDTTIALDGWSDGFVGLGDEFRYKPSEDTEGTFLAYAIDDPVDDQVRWKVKWDHETRNLPGGMRGVIKYQDFSDFQFFRDFERDFDDNTLRSIDSRGFLTGNWGPHSLNVLFNRRETFINAANTVRLTKLPEVEYQVRATRLGKTPFYLELDSSLDYLDLDRSEALRSTYVRADLFPQLMLPLRTVPWLSTSFTVGERLTYYGDRLRNAEELASRDPGDASAFAGDGLTRMLPAASAEIIGPSLSRIYEGKDGGKLKHVFEPRWTYTYLDRFDRTNEVPLFDEADTLTSTNQGRFALINRFLSKPPGDKGSAREVLLVELAQAVSFDPDQPLQQGFVTTQVDGVPQQERVTRSAGPVTTLLRYNPRPGTSIKAEASYNTLFGEIERTSLSGQWGFGGNAVDVTWFTRTRPDTGESFQNQVRLGGAIKLPGHLRVRGQINYDFEQSQLQQQRWIFDWTGSCCSLSLEVRDFQTGGIRDTDYRFAFSLKNVGTFLDFTGGFSNRPR